MQINYNRLWKSLIDKNMNKKALTEIIEFSPAIISKMGCGEVDTEVIHLIGVKLNVDFGDMISIIKKGCEDKWHLQ